MTTTKRTNEPRTTRGLYIVGIGLALMCIAVGVWLFGSVVSANGFRSHWRIALATSFATSVIDTLANEAQNWAE